LAAQKQQLALRLTNTLVLFENKLSITAVQHTALDPKQDAKASFYLCTWHVHNSQDPHKQQVKKRDPPKHSEITAV
jgi:hypothetical protein